MRDAQQYRTALGDFLQFANGFTVQATPTGKLVSLRRVNAKKTDFEFGVQTNSTVLQRFFGNNARGTSTLSVYATQPEAAAALPGVQAFVDSVAEQDRTDHYQQGTWGNPWPGDFGDPNDAQFVNPDAGIGLGFGYGIGIPQVGWSYNYKISALETSASNAFGDPPFTYGASAYQQAVRIRATIFARAGVPARIKITYRNLVYRQTMIGGLYFGFPAGVPWCNVLSRELLEETPGEMEASIGILGYNSVEMPLQDIVAAPWPDVDFATPPFYNSSYHVANQTMLQYALVIDNVEEISP